MKTAALIPCRKGSKGIPGKNFREFNGGALWKWTLNAALGASIFDNIIVSSDGGLYDNDRLAGIILDNDRPAELSTDEASLDDLLVYYAHKYPEIDLWALLQPTSPLRTAEDIKAAYAIVKAEKYDSLVSVTSNPGMLWVDNAAGLKGHNYPIATYHIHKRPNRQDRGDWYMENGAIYFTKKYVLEQMHCRLGGHIALYPMPQDRSLEIDTLLDWEIAEFVAASRKAVA